MKKLSIILGVMILILIAYDYSQSHQIGIGDSYSYKKVSECSSDTRIVIDKYGISNEIVDCQSKSFELNNKPVSFVHLEYGVGADCPSGCFFEHYCAVVEDKKDYPFAFYGDILKISVSDSRNADVSILTGKSHPLAQSSEFIEFLNKERKEDGEFRWCKDDF